LFGNHSAELRALGQTRELLGAVYDKLLRLHFHPKIKRAPIGRVQTGNDGLAVALHFQVLVLVLLGLFVEIERQTVAAFVSY
jgi:hypothetical protein